MARTLSTALLNLLSLPGAPAPSGLGAFPKGYLYEVTSPILGVARFADWETSVTYGGNVYASGVVIPKRGRMRWVLGLETDQLDLEIGHGGTAIYGSSSWTWAAAVLAGALDGATIKVYVAFFDTAGALVDAVLLFGGYVGEPEPLSSSIRLTVESGVAKLRGQWPRVVLGAGCPWTLYDANCGLTRPTTWDAKTTLAAAAVNQVKVASLTDQGFKLGAVQIVGPTSSPLYGLSRSIADVTAAGADLVLTVAPAWPSTPGAGLTVKVVKGCDGTALACGGSDGVSGFNNLKHFGGAPVVPPATARKG